MLVIVLNFIYMYFNNVNYSYILNEKILQLYNDYRVVCEFLIVGFIYMIIVLIVGLDVLLIVGLDVLCVLYVCFVLSGL